MGTKAYLFGSRANGTADTFSDVDIALRNGDGLVDGTIMSALLVNFEAAALPYKVDLVDLNAIPDEFRRAIEDDLLQLHRVLSRAPQTRMPI